MFTVTISAENIVSFIVGLKDVEVFFKLIDGSLKLKHPFISKKNQIFLAFYYIFKLELNIVLKHL
jgi:hypothetical protein